MAPKELYSLTEQLILFNYLWISQVKQILTSKNNIMKKLVLCVVLLILSFNSKSQGFRGFITDINQFCDSLETYICSQTSTSINQGQNISHMLAHLSVVTNPIHYSYNPYWLVTNIHNDTLFESYLLSPYIVNINPGDTIVITLTIEVTPSVGETIHCVNADTLYFDNTGMWSPLPPNTITTINEYKSEIREDNRIFDILGRPIKDYSLIPNGSIYILNNKKYIKIK
jgi:hypothetical protein